MKNFRIHSQIGYLVVDNEGIVKGGWRRVEDFRENESALRIPLGEECRWRRVEDFRENESGWQIYAPKSGGGWRILERMRAQNTGGRWRILERMRACTSSDPRVEAGGGF